MATSDITFPPSGHQNDEREDIVWLRQMIYCLWIIDYYTRFRLRCGEWYPDQSLNVIDMHNARTSYLKRKSILECSAIPDLLRFIHSQSQCTATVSPLKNVVCNRTEVDFRGGGQAHLDIDFPIPGGLY